MPAVVRSAIRYEASISISAMRTVVSRRRFFAAAPDWSHVTGTMMVDLADYAALAVGGADDPLVPALGAPIFPQIAAMKAGSPTSRKIRAMPAWISPAVRVPGARQGAGSARLAKRMGSVKASIWLIAYRPPARSPSASAPGATAARHPSGQSRA